jgi:hypothetical protein
MTWGFQPLIGLSTGAAGSFMGVLIVVVGLGVVVIGAYREQGLHKFKVGEWEFESTSFGLTLVALGIVTFFLSAAVVDSGNKSDTPTASKGATAQPPPTSTPTPAATPTPSSMAPSTATATPSTSPTATATASPQPSAFGPWEDEQHNVHLIVERIRLGEGVGGRLRVFLRLENDSADEVTAEEDDFLAVDSFGNSYHGDFDHSNWKSPGSYYGSDLDLDPGETQAGSILLDDQVPSGSAAVEIRLTVEKGFSSNHFTVLTSVPIDKNGTPVRPKP